MRTEEERELLCAKLEKSKANLKGGLENILPCLSAHSMLKMEEGDNVTVLEKKHRDLICDEW